MKEDVNCSVHINDVPNATTPINPDIPKDNAGEPLYAVRFADQVIAGLYLKENKKPTISQCRKAVRNLKTIEPETKKYIEMQWKYQLAEWDLKS